MLSTFGHLFRATTFGESHGKGVGVIVDGCPSRVPLDEARVQAQLDRRRPGQTHLNTPRDEKDRVTIQSGVQDGVTLGTPISLFVANRDQRPGDYSTMDDVPRPSHADLTYVAKYGIKARSGGGRASARETIGRVAAGSVADALLATFGIEIVAWVSAVGAIRSEAVDEHTVTRCDVDQSIIRCPDADADEQMIALVEEVLDAHDSIGGIVTCVCRGVPQGWGEPAFGKLEAMLAQGMLSIPATKGFEIGTGFAGTCMRGSEHNDAFLLREDGRLGTLTNRSGGIQGGISNGEPILFRVAFKPVATIGRAQPTVDYEGRNVVLEARGRHDPCVLPRAVPVVEGMAACVLADAALLHARMRLSPVF